MRVLRRFGRDHRGNISVLFASGFGACAVASAFAVDAGALYHERRVLQNAVDLAALSAAMDPADGEALAETALADAGLWPGGADVRLVVVSGRYNPDPALAPADRFAAGGLPVNAVSVHFEREGQLHLARGWAAPPTIEAHAVAAVTPLVSFSVGSRLASLNGGVVNAVLDTLLGASVALSVMDYQALLGARVEALALLDALALQLGVTAGSYDDLLALRADHGKLAAALATLLTGTERAAMLRLAAVAGHNGTAPLGKLFALGEMGRLRIGTGTGQGLTAAVSALELLSASAGLSDGTRQVSLALGAGVQGLVGIDASLAMGEATQGSGWFAIGPAGTVLRTAQTRLRIVATVLGSGALVDAPIRLPLYLDVAASEAVVGSATCPNDDAPKGTASILVRPGAARLALGEVGATTYGNFGSAPTVAAAKLVEVSAFGIPVLRVLASALVEIAQMTPISLEFSSLEIAAGTVKTARTTTAVTSLTTSLIDTLTLNVPILGLGLNLTGLRTLLRTILLPVAPTLDLVIARLLDAVGVGVGEADVSVHGVRCTHPVLVG